MSEQLLAELWITWMKAWNQTVSGVRDLRLTAENQRTLVIQIVPYTTNSGFMESVTTDSFLCSAGGSSGLLASALPGAHIRKNAWPAGTPGMPAASAFLFLRSSQEPVFE